MMGGVASAVEVLRAAIPGFQLHPLDKDSKFPPITSHLVEEGFPVLVSTLFKYFKTRQRKFNPNNASFDQPSATSEVKSKHRFDDDAEYQGQQKYYGTLLVSGDINVFDAVDELSWDLSDVDIELRPKQHQSGCA